MVWANGDYRYKKQITIDNTKVAGDETNFPVLISVIDNDLRDTTNGGHVTSSSGYDICFYDSAETVLLDHELELYTAASGTVIFWVCIPSLSGTDDTIIYMYYGNENIVADQSSTDTWNSTYKIVTHMNEAAGNITDSTSNVHDGTTAGNPTYRQAGKIGYAITLDGNQDSFDFGDHADFTPATGQTLFFWIKQNLGAANRFLCAKEKGLPGATADYALDADGDAVVGGLGFYIKDDDTAGYIGRRDSDGGQTLEDNWHQLVVTWDGGTAAANIKIFIDSVQTDDANYSGGVFTARSDSAAKLALGTDLYNDPPDGTYDWIGDICEFRFLDDDLSSNWITTEFNNQDDPASFYGIGGETGRGTLLFTSSTITYYHDCFGDVQHSDSRDVRVMNFWDNSDIKVMDEGLNSKNITISGYEHTGAFSKMTDMDTVTNNGEVITLHNMVNSVLNTTWVIKSFSYTIISPEAVGWTLNLEKYY